MKRPSLRDACEWIALNDNAGSTDGLEEIAGYVSTLLIADLFGKEPGGVAARILTIRREHIDESGHWRLP